MKKVLTLTLLGGLVTAGSAYAFIEQTIDVFATMRVGLAFANKVDMNFTPSSGHIDFYGAPSNAADFVTMGTDGSVAVVGTVLQASANTGTPGSVDVTSDGVSQIDLSCTTGATLAEPAGKTLAVDSLEIALNTGVAYQNAAAYACAGTGTTPKTFTANNSGTDKIILGGRLVAQADVITAVYDSTQTGGTPATVRVLYH